MTALIPGNFTIVIKNKRNILTKYKKYKITISPTAKYSN